MAGLVKYDGVVLLILVALSSAVVSGHEEMVDSQTSRHNNISGKEVQSNLVYKHVWPEMRFSWKIVVGTLIAFIGAAFGSMGGVGGGGFFIPILTLLIGFDQKSAVAVSKCMITGTATATVMYNLRRRHPTLELPMIDYNLALLFQPVLVLGISTGVSLNVVLPDWMLTILLFIVLLGVSTKAFFKGIKTWKKETQTKKVDAYRHLESNDVENRDSTEGPRNGNQAETKETKRKEVSLLDNVCWKELGGVVAVWIIILALQIAKNYVTKCSFWYWLIELLQIPVAVGVTSYQAVNLYKGRSVIASKGEATTWLPVQKLVAYSVVGTVAGVLGGLLGLGGAFLLSPLFLEMGIPPQVSSATATFAMVFSSSMSVVEYYLLKRFPIPYALYFAAVTTISAVVGQVVVGKMVKKLGRASLIIFILAFTIFVSSLTLGGSGIGKLVKDIKHKESLGFQSICT